MEVFCKTRPELKALSHQIVIMPEPKKFLFILIFFHFILLCYDLGKIVILYAILVSHY